MLTYIERTGDAYFDSIDEQIKNDTTLLKDMCSRANHQIIASGGFVQALERIGVTPAVSVIGGLRKSRQIDLSQYKDIINGNTFTFIDDSYYKGRTLNKINKEIIRLGGTITQVIVGYDDACDMPFIESYYQKS